MAYLQVVCNQENWMDSVIRVFDVKNEAGRFYDPGLAFLTAKELPDNLKQVFLAMVQSFQQQGNQEWFVSEVTCRKINATVYDSNKNPIDATYVSLMLHLNYPDYTKDTTEIKEINKSIVGLFDELTTGSFWKLYLDTGFAGYKEGTADI